MKRAQKARYCVITPLGYRVLRALDRGTYKAVPSSRKRLSKRGTRQRRAARAS